MLVSLYILVFGKPGLPRMAGMSLGSLTTTKFLKGTRNLRAGARPQSYMWNCFCVEPNKQYTSDH